MIHLGIISLLHLYLTSVHCDFEIIKEDTLRQEPLQENDEAGHLHKCLSKFPSGFRTEYPPSLPYLIWLENDKRFPTWLLDMVRAEDPSGNFEWRLEQLSKLYKDCDTITGGYPLSGKYIRDLLEMVYMQNRIDEGDIIRDIDTEEDLQYLKGLQLPAANDSKIKLQLTDDVLRNVDPIGYMRAFVLKNSLDGVRLNEKLHSPSQEQTANGRGQALDIVPAVRNTTMEGINLGNKFQDLWYKHVRKESHPTSVMNSNETIQTLIQSIKNHITINKFIDLIKENNIKISKEQRKELQKACREFLRRDEEEQYRNISEDSHHLSNKTATKYLENAEENTRKIKIAKKLLDILTRQSNKLIVNNNKPKETILPDNQNHINNLQVQNGQKLNEQTNISYDKKKKPFKQSKTKTKENKTNDLKQGIF